MASISYSDSVRYQVFVSSTYVDLIEARSAVTMALLSADAIPAGMELFPATDGDAWTLIQEVIKDSDYYLLVIGGKYGSIDEVTDLSYTEKEYDFASSLGKPTMAFIHGDPDNLTRSQIELDADKQQRLEAFMAKVRLGHHVNLWTTPEDLVGKVLISLNKIIKSHPATGWVKADRASSTETLEELAKTKIQLAELEGKNAGETRSVVLDTSNIRGGADKLNLDMWCVGRFMDMNSILGPNRGKWIIQETTYDELFYAFGADLIAEKNEEEILYSLENWAKFRYAYLINNSLVDLAESFGETGDRTNFANSLRVNLGTNANGNNQIIRLLLQFKALGLIDKTDSNSNGAIGTFWTLTPLGEQNSILYRPQAE